VGGDLMNNNNLYRFLSVAVIWGSIAYSKPVTWWLAVIGGVCTVFIYLGQAAEINVKK
jgi:hypothetical protein